MNLKLQTLPGLFLSISRNRPIPIPLSIHFPRRRFSSTTKTETKNRIYTPVRYPADLSTYLLLSSSSRTPLLTLWTTSSCPTCRIVSPLLQSLVTAGVGEEEGGVAYCEVEYDAPDIMSAGLGMTYMITSMPTLLAFDERGEVRMGTRVVEGKRLRDREWLEEWIKEEARNGGGDAGGGSGGSGLFGGLFGSSR